MGSSLRPIPSKILKSSATVNVCSGVDFYQNPTFTTYSVTRVHLQPTNEIRKTLDNTDCTLRAILFVDARISKPLLDWCALLKTAHDNKGDMKATIRGVEYTVMGVDELRDDTDNIHHWEVSLV